MYLRQSTAVDLAIGPFVDDADGVTPMTGLTISQADVRLKKNNGAWAQINDNTSATHEENGWYEKEFDATDTNTVGRLLVAVHESGALPVWHEFWVLEEAIYDALFAASATGLLPANVTQFGGSNGTFSGGRPEVNATHWAGTAVASATILNAANIGADAITAAKVASDVGTEIGTAVWATTTRLLTAGTNIVLAKGTGVTGFNDLSAAQVNAEVDTAISDAALATAANLATVDNVVDAIKLKTDNLPSDPADASDIAAAFASVAATLGTPVVTIADDIAGISAGTGPTASEIADEVQTRSLIVGTNNDKTGYSVSGVVSANIVQINNVTVNGDGAGTPWGP
jgi:hypothetical protein